MPDTLERIEYSERRAYSLFEQALRSRRFNLAVLILTVAAVLSIALGLFRHYVAVFGTPGVGDRIVTGTEAWDALVASYREI